MREWKDINARTDAIIVIMYSEKAIMMKDIIIIKDEATGAGEYIAVWNHPTLAQPTQEQLEAVGG